MVFSVKEVTILVRQVRFSCLERSDEDAVKIGVFRDPLQFRYAAEHLPGRGRQH